ncbi:anti-sigma factor antagonist [Streptomyces sp. NPDC059176]|uniref:anti-sigma factor antagonist n=1 Tax=unclassified Streptomyces TaxID=2593676 RepID=UPI0036CC654D
MSISWRVEEQRGATVMSVAGFLGSNAVSRFSEGFGWVVARSTGPVIVDLAELLGWSAEGELAVLRAATAIRSSGRSLAFCGLDHLEATNTWGDHLASIAVYPDLDTALDAQTRSD